MADEPWYSALPETLTVEHNGQQIPLREHSLVKDAPDLPTFARMAYDLRREVGARVPLKVEKPEDVQAWRKEHLPKLHKAGILEAPPATPAEYGITKPDALPDGLSWSDELSGKLAATLHKYGVPKGAAADLLALHTEALLGAQPALKTSVDEGMKALKAEHGDKFDERYELATRLTKQVFKSDEEVAFFEQTGLANHPGLLSLFMRLAPLAQQDSSFMGDTKTTGAQGAEGARAEIAAILGDPKHPIAVGRMKGDPAAQARWEELHRLAYGTGEYVAPGSTGGR